MQYMKFDVKLMLLNFWKRDMRITSRPVYVLAAGIAIAATSIAIRYRMYVLFPSFILFVRSMANKRVTMIIRILNSVFFGL